MKTQIRLSKSRPLSWAGIVTVAAILLATISKTMAATTLSWSYATPPVTYPTTASSADLVMSAGTYVVGQLITLPAAGGIAAGTYYIVSVSGTTITVSTTPGGTAVAATSTTSGNTATYRYDWTDTTRWTSANVPNTSSELANFGNPPSSYPGLSVSGSQTIYGLTFSGAGNADLAIDGGADGAAASSLNFATDDASTPIVTMNSSGTGRLISFGGTKPINFSGSSGLNFRSAVGTVTGSELAATAPSPTKQIRLAGVTWTGFSGGITVDRGLLQIQNTDQLPTSQDLTVGGTFSSANGLLAGFSLNGKNQTVGNLNGNAWGRIHTSGTAATLTVGNSNATGGNYGGSLGLVFEGTGTPVSLTKTGSGTQTISGNIGGTGGVTGNGASGTLILSGNNTYTGSTVAQSGTLAGIGANAFGSTSVIQIQSAGTLSLRGDANTSFVKASDGTSYALTASASGATINVDQATVAGTSAKTMTIGTLGSSSTAASYQLNFSGANNTSLSLGAVTGAASTSASGSVTFANAISGSGSLTIASYTSANTGGGETLTFNGVGNTLVSGAVSQNGANTMALVMNGSGTLRLSGNNAYNGNTTISAGTLQAGSATAIPSGAGKGNVVLNGGSSAAGTLDLNGFDLSVNGLSGTSSTVLGQVVNNAPSTAKTLTVGNSDVTSTFAGLLANNTGNGGTLALAKTGSGTLTLSAANTFTGGLAVNAGRVVANGNVSAFGGSANTITLGDNSGADATMEVGGAWISDLHPVTVVGSGIRMIRGTWNNTGQVQGFGPVTLSPGDIRFQQTSLSPNRFQSGITGNGNVIVTNTSSGWTDFRTTNINNVGFIRNDSTGTGGIQQGAAGGNFGPNVISLIQNSATAAWTIAQPNNSYLGTVQVLLGTMAAQNSGALNSGNVVSVASGAIFDVQNVNLTIAGLNDVSGAGGTVTDTTGSAVRTLTLGGAGNYSFSGAITAATPANRALTVNLSSGGVQTLSGANTYTGNTTISAGTLALSGSGSLASLNMTIAPGAVFDVSAVTPSSYSLNGAGSLALRVNRTGATLTQGQLAIGTKTLNYGGALTVVSNANSQAFAAGNSFTLVATNTGAALAGWFSSVTLPALASGLAWDTNNLATTGILDVYSFTTTALEVSTPKNTAATVNATKMGNHAISSKGTAVAVSASTPSNGTASISSGSLTYTPNTGYEGSDSFTVTYSDGRGVQTMAVSVTVGSGTGLSPNLLGQVVAGGDFIVSFAGYPGESYTVETNEIVGPGWVKLGNFTAPNDGIISVTNNIGTNSMFFRTVWPSY